MSFANAHLLPGLGASFRPLIGRDPYNKKSVDDALKATEANVKVLEDHLLVNTYLVSERFTLADLFTAGIASRGFQFFWDPEWRSNHPNITRWFNTVISQDIYKAVVENTVFTEKALENKPQLAPRTRTRRRRRRRSLRLLPSPRLRRSPRSRPLLRPRRRRRPLLRLPSPSTLLSSLASPHSSLTTGTSNHCNLLPSITRLTTL